MARCGRTNLAGGGGVGSDETTATKDKVLKDYTYLGADTDDEIGTGTIESMKGTTVTPSASQQTVSTSGKYLTGDVIVSAVANLNAANIANGKVVGGTTGTYKGLGNATAAQVLAGKTFSTASLSNTAGTMINYSGYTSTSNYTSGTFKSGTTGYIFVVPGGTGYYSNATYLRIPATNLSAANIKKGVKILGITGTHDGFVPTSMDIYNRGTFGNGYSSSNITTYKSGNCSAAITFETSAIKLVYTQSSGQTGGTASIQIGSASSPINFTPYSSFKAIVKDTSATHTSSSNGTQARKLDATVYGTSNSTLATITYTPATAEQTITINLSSVNVSGYIRIELVYKYVYGGGAHTITAYANRLYFE